jgi:hypothetical protein
VYVAPDTDNNPDPARNKRLTGWWGGQEASLPGQEFE